MFGGVSLLRFLMQGEPGYVDNLLRHDLFRARDGLFYWLSALGVVWCRHLSVLHSPKCREFESFPSYHVN
jgi:hypothetical protein